MLQPNEEGCARMVISNPSSYPQVAVSGNTIGEVIAAAVVKAEVLPELNDDQGWWSEVRRVSDGGMPIRGNESCGRWCQSLGYWTPIRQTNSLTF